MLSLGKYFRDNCQWLIHAFIINTLNLPQNRKTLNITVQTFKFLRIALDTNRRCTSNLFFSVPPWSRSCFGLQQQKYQRIKGEASRTDFPHKYSGFKDVRLSTLFSMKRSDSAVARCHPHSLFFLFSPHLFLTSCLFQVFEGHAENGALR